MNTNINPHAQVYQRFRTELAEVVKWSNRDYTNSAITRERARHMMVARKNLLGAIPAAATATGPTPAEYIDSLRPTTADQVAVAQFEWGQAVALLDSGRSRPDHPHRLACEASGGGRIHRHLARGGVIDCARQDGGRDAFPGVRPAVRGGRQGRSRETGSDGSERLAACAGRGVGGPAERLHRHLTAPVRPGGVGGHRPFGVRLGGHRRGPAGAGAGPGGPLEGGGLMPPGQRTRPELEQRAVAMICDGKTRAQVSEATGIHTRTLTEIAKRNQVDWARTGSGSSGTPEAMNQARDYRSE